MTAEAEVLEELRARHTLTASTYAHRWGTESHDEHSHGKGADPEALLMVECWCRRHVRYLTADIISRGLTESCGHARCTDPGVGDPPG